MRTPNHPRKVGAPAPTMLARGFVCPWMISVFPFIHSCSPPGGIDPVAQFFYWLGLRILPFPELLCLRSLWFWKLCYRMSYNLKYYRFYSAKIWIYLYFNSLRTKRPSNSMRNFMLYLKPKSHRRFCARIFSQHNISFFLELPVIHEIFVFGKRWWKQLKPWSIGCGFFLKRHRFEGYLTFTNWSFGSWAHTSRTHPRHFTCRFWLIPLVRWHLPVFYYFSCGLVAQFSFSSCYIVWSWLLH